MCNNFDTTANHVQIQKLELTTFRALLACLHRCINDLMPRSDLGVHSCSCNSYHPRDYYSCCSLNFHTLTFAHCYWSCTRWRPSPWQPSERCHRAAALRWAREACPALSARASWARCLKSRVVASRSLVLKQVSCQSSLGIFSLAT